MPADPYSYWRDALEGRFAPINELEPQLGVYRLKRGNEWRPLMICEQDGMLWAIIGREGDSDASCDQTEVCERWVSAARYPVTKEAYAHFNVHGTWPGQLPLLLGNNKPPADGPDALLGAMVEKREEADAWIKGRKIVSKADADACEAWCNALADLKRKATTEHSTEKAPILKAQRECDRRWLDPIRDIETTVRTLKNAVTAFLLAEQRAREEAARKAVVRGDPIPARTELRATTSGSSGRKVHLRERRTAIVEDPKKFIAHLLKNNNADLHRALQNIANSHAQLNTSAPGITIKTEQVAA